jgi:hypothetical protein
MMREAKAANTDLDAAHVIAEHLALNPGARINWEQFLKSYRQAQEAKTAATPQWQFLAIPRNFPNSQSTPPGARAFGRFTRMDERRAEAPTRERQGLRKRCGRKSKAAS